MTALLIRAHGNEGDARALRAHGIDSVIDPYIEIGVVDNPAGVKRLCDALAMPDAVVVLTSPNALDAWRNQFGADEFVKRIRANRHLSGAAVGTATAQQLREVGINDIIVPANATAAALSTLLTSRRSGVAIVPTGTLTDGRLVFDLRTAGFTVIDEIVYSTTSASRTPVTASAMPSEVDFVVLRSPSAAQAFAEFAGPQKLPAVCAGPTTAATARELGIEVWAESPSPDPESVANVASLALSERAN